MTNGLQVAVAGGTGLVGRLTVAELEQRGHRVTVLARSRGVDLTTGAGVLDALRPVDAVIDVSNVTTSRRGPSEAFFRASTGHLLAAEAELGIGHHLALSIVGIDGSRFGYYRGKQVQEQLIEAGPVPWTILRATQFHEFAAQLTERTRGSLVVPAMRSQPVAARDVAAALADLIWAGPSGRAPELAGPEVLEMVDLVRRLLHARGLRRRVWSVRLPGSTGRMMAAGGLLPKPGATLTTYTFDQWLQDETRSGTVPV